MALTREALLALKPPVTAVTLPAGHGIAYIRGLTAGEHQRFLDWLTANEATNYLGIHSVLVTRSLCDEHGTLLFQEDEVVLVDQLPKELVYALYRAASELNAITPEAQEALEGNSGPAPTDAPSSPSPSSSGA